MKKQYTEEDYLNQIIELKINEKEEEKREKLVGTVSGIFILLIFLCLGIMIGSLI